MFFCRRTQEHQDKIVSQLALQMNEALKREDDHLARDIAKKEAEQEQKCKEKEAKEKAAIESIAEHRATVVRNLACSYSCLLQPQLVAPVPCISMLHQVCWHLSWGPLCFSHFHVGPHLPGLLKTLGLDTGQSQWPCLSEHWYRAASAERYDFQLSRLAPWLTFFWCIL